MEISLNLPQECNREILYSSLNSKEVVDSLLSVWQYNVQPVASFVFQFVTVALWGQTTLVNVTDIADNVPASLM